MLCSGGAVRYSGHSCRGGRDLAGRDALWKSVEGLLPLVVGGRAGGRADEGLVADAGGGGIAGLGKPGCDIRLFARVLAEYVAP